MRDITSNNLRYALLDQIVAGKMTGKDYAYVPVMAGDGWGVGLAVANERGYIPIEGDGLSWLDHAECGKFCDGMNAHIGLTDHVATRIITSTMGGRAFLGAGK